MDSLHFDAAFKALTDNAPFPWQRDLYENWFAKGNTPASCNLPTGLGKTSVIAVWLVALANGHAVPRRLVYVVNRRTVVDQTTDEVEKYRENLEKAGIKEPLAISTLRGQFADNREWSADPSRPAVICGTVDMIGSRLLFSGYGCSFRTRPLHAGFLGQDALVVHDEAHLEPAFQELLIAIRDEQARCKDFRPLKVMELTATSRAEGEAFPNDEERKANEAHPVVQQRLNATKALHLHVNKDEKKLADEIGALARAVGEKHAGTAILVFVRKVDDVKNVIAKLPRDSYEQLTGTLRGYERDGLVERPIFKRFLPKAEKKPETVYLVCTSAGEVGVNISADHLVCDLSTFESMAQRFGRVNRFGERDDTEIHVIHPTKFADDDPVDAARERTLHLLRELNEDASPAALGKLDPKARQAAFAPTPTILPTSDILFDSWALTTVRELPGRPPVDEYLHGVEDEKKRETQVAWRAEVEPFHKVGIDGDQIAELLDQFPLKPHELLRDATHRVQKQLAELAKGREDLPVWVIDADETVRVVKLAELAEEDKKGYKVNLSGRTVVLPPAAGGLTATGTLDGKADPNSDRKYDVAGWYLPASRVPVVRLAVTSGEEKRVYKPISPARDPGAEVEQALDLELELDNGVKREEEAREIRKRCIEVGLPPMRIAFRIDLQDDEDEPQGTVEYLVLKPEARREESKREAAWPSLDGHLKGVKAFAEAICSRLSLPAHVEKAATLAASWHDLGKDRGVWQRGAGNVRRDSQPVAKTLHGRPPENLNGFRHELASMVDVCFDPLCRDDYDKQTDDCRELLLHLIATHHGRGRPHFPAKEAQDVERPASASESLVAEMPQRFAKLQRQYGRWGLAYLESLLRAADALDSKRIEETPIGDRETGSWPRPKPPGFARTTPRQPPKPSISVNVDPTNPGQFFACCGLLELADRLWPDPGAEGWFADGQFHVQGGGTLAEFVQAIRRAKLTQLDPDDPTGSRVNVGEPFRELRLDWWQDERAGGKELKVWAGQMRSHRIAEAMQYAMNDERFATPDLLNIGMIAYEPGDPDKKVEPYYFDARRCPNAHSRDVGFSPNDLDMTTTAHPAVELLCLVGLQRCLPAKTDEPRIFDYFTWSEPLALVLLPAAVSGLLPHLGSRGYRFENWFRTGQRKHKAFRSAIPLSLKVPK